jgi:hypothetical protein
MTFYFSQMTAEKQANPCMLSTVLYDNQNLFKSVKMGVNIYEGMYQFH